MDLSGKLKKVNAIVNILLDNINLFDCFNHVYLFGSAIKSNSPNDIDLLLVYNELSDVIISSMHSIRNTIEEKYSLFPDLTVLSYKELSSTIFLNKISTYIKIK